MRPAVRAGGRAWAHSYQDFRTPITAYRQRGRKRRVLVENVRFLAGYRRSGLVDETPLEHAFARVVDGNRSVSVGLIVRARTPRLRR